MKNDAKGTPNSLHGHCTDCLTLSTTLYFTVDPVMSNWADAVLFFSQNVVIFDNNILKKKEYDR